MDLVSSVGSGKFHCVGRSNWMPDGSVQTDGENEKKWRADAAVARLRQADGSGLHLAGSDTA